MKKTVLTIAVLILAARSLQAAVITQTKTFSGQPNYSSVLTFNQFDDHGGTYTLNSVFLTVVLNTAAGASLGIDNDGAQSASGLVEFGSNGSITSSDVGLNKASGGTFYGSLASVSGKTMNLSADDNDGVLYSTAGTDYGVLTTSATSKSTNAYIKSSVFEDYIGAGTYTLTYGVNQYMNMAAFSGVQFQGNPVTADGSISIEYDYTIPEPASMSLIAVAIGAAAWIRRRFIN